MRATAAAAVALSAAAQHWPEPEQRGTQTAQTIEYGWGKWLEVVFLGVQEPRGTKEAMISSWMNLALISALLCGLAASGMYSSASFIHTLAEAKAEDGGSHDSGFLLDDLSFSVEAKHTMAMWTMKLFCIDTFAFLTATMSSAFFMSFASRERYHDLPEICKVLGALVHVPDIYFRVGFYLLVVSLSCFFIMVMPVHRMFGCLAVCISLIMAPLFVSIKRASSTFDLEFRSAGRSDAGAIEDWPKLLLRLQAAELDEALLKPHLADTMLMNTLLQEAGFKTVGHRLKIIQLLKTRQTVTAVSRTWSSRALALKEQDKAGGTTRTRSGTPGGNASPSVDT